MDNFKKTFKNKDLILEKMKTSLELTFKRNKPLDIRQIKQYHQIKIEQKYNFYFSPLESEKISNNKILFNFSDEEEIKELELNSKINNFKNLNPISSFSKNKFEYSFDKFLLQNNNNDNNVNYNIPDISNFFDCFN